MVVLVIGDQRSVNGECLDRAARTILPLLQITSILHPYGPNSHPGHGQMAQRTQCLRMVEPCSSRNLADQGGPHCQCRRDRVHRTKLRRRRTGPLVFPKRPTAGLRYSRVHAVRREHGKRCVHGAGDAHRATAPQNLGIAKEGFDPAFGARPLKRSIQRLVLDPLARKVIAGEIKEGSTVKVDVSSKATDSLVFSAK